MVVRGAPTHETRREPSESALGWATIPVTGPAGPQIHCVPVDDIRPHQLCEHCACKPEIDDISEIMLVHVAWDGRLDYTSGKRAHH